jgi:hypothetical protein
MNVDPSRRAASSRAAERRASPPESLAGDAASEASPIRFDGALAVVVADGSSPGLVGPRRPRACSASAGAATVLALIAPLSHGFWTSSDKAYEFVGLDRRFRLMRVPCQRRNLFGNSGMMQWAALFCDRIVAIE